MYSHGLFLFFFFLLFHELCSSFSQASFGIIDFILWLWCAAKFFDISSLNTFTYWPNNLLYYVDVIDLSYMSICVSNVHACVFLLIGQIWKKGVLQFFVKFERKIQAPREKNWRLVRSEWKNWRQLQIFLFSLNEQSRKKIDETDRQL